MFFKVGVFKISQISQETPVQESFNNVAGPKACNIVKMRLQHRRFPVKFDKFLRTSPVAASEFCSSGSVIIVSVSNIKCTVNQCIKVSV